MPGRGETRTAVALVQLDERLDARIRVVAEGALADEIVLVEPNRAQVALVDATADDADRTIDRLRADRPTIALIGMGADDDPRVAVTLPRTAGLAELRAALASARRSNLAHRVDPPPVATHTARVWDHEPTRSRRTPGRGTSRPSRRATRWGSG